MAIGPGKQLIVQLRTILIKHDDCFFCHDPALAASFSLIAPHGHVINHPSFSTSWTVETVPGWFMAVCWSIYFIFNHKYFEGKSVITRSLIKLYHVG